MRNPQVFYHEVCLLKVQITVKKTTGVKLLHKGLFFCKVRVSMCRCFLPCNAGAEWRGWLRLVLDAAGDGSGGTAVAYAELQEGNDTTWEITKWISSQTINLLSSLLRKALCFTNINFLCWDSIPEYLFMTVIDSKALHISGHRWKIPKVINLYLNICNYEYKLAKK